jgi:hypothetical protein
VLSTRVILLVVAVGLAASATALASPQFVSTFAGTYASQTPRSPSGFDALASWTDAGEPGGKPKEVDKIKVLFNPGSKLDTRALPTCNASAEDIANLAVRACPAKTKLGEVHGIAVYSAGSAAPFNTFATLFNAKRQIIVVVTLDNPKGRLLTDFRDDVRPNSITINLKVGKGISLIRFQAHVPSHVRKQGKKRRVYFTTPKSCPASGAWTTTVVFSYRDGSSDQHSAPSPCKPKT